MRYFFTLCQAWKHRQALHQYVIDSQKQLATVTDLTPARLTSLGCQYLVLDFDGVLASHGEMTLPLPIQTWLQNILKESQIKGCFILSNKPKKQRFTYFHHYFPTIQFIKATRKKPYPDGLNTIIAKTNTAPEHILLIDDRLLTGCLAAVLAKCQCLHITHPNINFAKRPIRETFFFLLRLIENKLFK